MFTIRELTEINKRNASIMYKLNTGIGIDVEAGRYYLINNGVESNIGRFTNYKELKKLQTGILKVIKDTNNILDTTIVSHIIRGK